MKVYIYDVANQRLWPGEDGQICWESRVEALAAVRAEREENAGKAWVFRVLVAEGPDLEAYPQTHIREAQNDLSYKAGFES